MSFRLTCYCSACNSPPGSTETASGIAATEGVTVAVHPSLYSRNKEIYIEGVGSRRIQDKHGNSKNVIDIYVGDRSYCSCSSHPLSGMWVDVDGL